MSIKKVNQDKLRILEELCTKLPQMSPAESDYETLLHAHLEEVVMKIRLLRAKGQYTSALNMSRPEALAFMYYWRGIDVKLPMYETEVLRQINMAVDQREVNGR